MGRQNQEEEIGKGYGGTEKEDAEREQQKKRERGGKKKETSGAEVEEVLERT